MSSPLNMYSPEAPARTATKHHPSPRKASPWAVGSKAGARRSALPSEHGGTWRCRKQLVVPREQLMTEDEWRKPSKSRIDRAHVIQAKRAWLTMRAQRSMLRQGTSAEVEESPTVDVGQGDGRTLVMRSVHIKDCQGDAGLPAVAVRFRCEEVKDSESISQATVYLCATFHGLPGTRRGAGRQRPERGSPGSPSARSRRSRTPSPTKARKGEGVEGWMLALQNWTETCPYCGVTYDEGAPLADVHPNCGQKPVECSLCGLSLLSQDLEKHTSSLCAARTVTCADCKSSMTFGRLAEHNEKTCVFRLVPCDHCDEGVRVSQLPHHSDLCKALPASCRHCGVEMTRGDLDKHSANECRQRTVECEKCGKGVVAERLGQHMLDECAERSVQCRHCHTAMSSVELESHEASCQQAILSCPTCAMPVERRGLAVHMLKDCPNRVLQCPTCQIRISALALESHTARCPMRVTACQACGERVTAKDLDSHVESCDNVRERCRMCFQAVPRTILDEHMRACPRRPYLCQMCGKEMHAEDKEDHWAHECPLKPQRCRFCEAIVAKADMHIHLDGCMSIPIVCPACTQEMLRYQFTAHKARSCPGRTVRCLMCGDKTVSARLGEHEQSVCPAHPVACDACGTACRPHELDTHKGVCEFRGSTCDYCGSWVQSSIEELHQQTCACIPVSCRVCGIVLLRPHLENHLLAVHGEESSELS